RSRMDKAALLRHIKSTDEEAFRRLFNQYSEPVYKMLLEQCKDRQLAREMLKSTFLQVQQTLKSEDEIDSTYLWLNVLAKAQLEKHLIERSDRAAVLASLLEAPLIKVQAEEAAEPKAKQWQEPEPIQPPASADLNPASVQAIRLLAKEQPLPKSRSRAGRVFVLTLLGVLILCVLWVIAGL
ncbi:MAG TPA: hypothetical protein PLH38_05590, partial [Clostridia bacterium]|nr:hypothetical protein [Clostridia bacterium]